MWRRAVLNTVHALRQSYRQIAVQDCKNSQPQLNARGLRFTHTSYNDQDGIENRPAELRQRSDSIELAHAGQSTRVHYFWLREHCRCPTCWNAATSQKNIQFHDVDPNITAAECQLDGENLNIAWPDGHRSSYSLKWLFENDPANSLVPKTKKVLWDAEIYKNMKVERLKYKDFMNEEECLKTFLKNFATYGFAFVDEVPADIDHTQKVSERVGHIHHTLFGSMWSLEADGARADTAYTNIALGAHTDMTYFQQTTGIQVFHCLYHDGKGGETLMEDGFTCAQKLKETNPEAFDVLANTFVRHDYIEPSHGQHIQSLERIIQLHPLTNEIEQFRYNNYDRIMVNTIPFEQIMKFYNSLKALVDIVDDDKNVHWEKLWPGTVYFVDNWRVMHGRKAFTGKRVVCGNYIERDTWTSRARSSGIL